MLIEDEPPFDAKDRLPAFTVKVHGGGDTLAAAGCVATETGLTPTG